MSAFLKDLRGLNVLVLAPNDREGQLLTGQLRRFGCSVENLWPFPSAVPALTDVVFVSIPDEDLESVKRFLASAGASPPTMIAIVGYENPAILQVVLENNFCAIIERPVRTFGLLANLVVARNVWLQHQSTLKEMRNYKRRALGDQKVLRAKAVLMALQGVDEEEAYKQLRAQAQAQRLPIETIADQVLKTTTSTSTHRKSSGPSA